MIHEGRKRLVGSGVAEEGWAGISGAGEPDSAGTDDEGFGGGYHVPGLGWVGNNCAVSLDLTYAQDLIGPLGE
jgi:hypothetical protein